MLLEVRRRKSWSVARRWTAAQGSERAAETLRQSAWATKGMLGVCLTNLAGVLTERLQLDEGRGRTSWSAVAPGGGLRLGALDQCARRFAPRSVAAPTMRHASQAVPMQPTPPKRHTTAQRGPGAGHGCRRCCSKVSMPTSCSVLEEGSGNAYRAGPLVG